MPEAVNQVSAFTIRELTGRKRVVQLMGRALPYRPFELHTKQRVELTWLPGSPEATSTVLGAAEDPTTCNGQWKDKYLGTTVVPAPERPNAILAAISGVASQLGPVGGALGGLLGGSPPTPNLTFPFELDGVPVRDVRAAVSWMDSICREGQLLEVVWDEQTRWGHLTEFSKRWHTRHDVEWDMKFEWISRGEPHGPPVFMMETSASDIASIFGKLLASIKAKFNFPGFSMAADFVADMRGLMDELDSSVGAVAGAVSALDNIASTPGNTARRLEALCNHTSNVCSSMVARVDRQPYGAIAFSASGSVNGQTFGAKLQASVWAKEFSVLALTLRAEANLRRTALGKQLDGDLLGTYVARTGDDLRDVSKQFYGTPNEWRRLLTYNELEGAELEPGEVVLVPKILVGVNP
jgi:hypothetical protein